MQQTNPNPIPTAYEIIQKAIDSLKQGNIETNYVNLISKTEYSGPDESYHLLLIYQENEHFINRFNELQAEESDSQDAIDFLSQTANEVQDIIINDLDYKGLHFEFSPAKYPTGLYIAYTEHNDLFTMQVTDSTWYITLTQSGQY